MPRLLAERTFVGVAGRQSRHKLRSFPNHSSVGRSRQRRGKPDPTQFFGAGLRSLATVGKNFAVLQGEGRGMALKEVADVPDESGCDYDELNQGCDHHPRNIVGSG